MQNDYTLYRLIKIGHPSKSYLQKLILRYISDYSVSETLAQCVGEMCLFLGREHFLCESFSWGTRGDSKGVKELGQRTLLKIFGVVLTPRQSNVLVWVRTC